METQRHVDEWEPHHQNGSWTNDVVDGNVSFSHYWDVQDISSTPLGQRQLAKQTPKVLKEITSCSRQRPAYNNVSFEDKENIINVSPKQIAVKSPNTVEKKVTVEWILMTCFACMTTAVLF
jgi:hypothetical protein